MKRFATIKKSAEGCGPPAGFELYQSRVLSNAVTASTNRQSTSNRIRTCSQDERNTRPVTSQAPFLVPILKTVHAASRSVRSLSRIHTRKGANASVAVLFLLTGCHSLHVGSPQIQRAPEIRCIVIVQSNTISKEIAELAVNACKDAIDQKQPVTKEPTKP